MLSCKACNHELDDADHFCGSCGQPTSTVIDLVSAAPGPHQPITKRSSDAPHNTRRTVAAMVAVAALIMTTVIVMRSPERQDTSVAEPEARIAEPDPANGTSRSSTDRTADPQDFVGLAPDGLPPPSLSGLSTWDSPEHLVLITDPNEVMVFDLVAATRMVLAAPEPLVDENPAALNGNVIVIGETRAWAHPLAPAGTNGWIELGPADRVRISTKPDRVWLRSRYEKERPSDADFLWNEVDLTGHVHRTMFRNRDIYFPTPELVSGIGGDLFRLTDADPNPWRLFSPYGVIIAVGHNDVITKECDRNFDCERVWYDPATAIRRDAIYDDLAANIPASYGARLSLDARFVYTQTAEGRTRIRSTASPNQVLSSQCLWEAPLVWSADSEYFVCLEEGAATLYETDTGNRIGRLTNGFEDGFATFIFVPPGKR